MYGHHTKKRNHEKIITQSRYKPNKSENKPTFPCIISRMVMLTNDESTFWIGSVAILFGILIFVVD